ncbi:MAG: phage head closure protein [Clostridiaceae bacterium]|nr:phage head closure protein [Clostridiaceae bacterium]
MILDKGICTIYDVKNAAPPGSKPQKVLVQKYQSWYAELDFETVPKDAAMQEMVETSARIRVLQNRSITNHDVVILADGKQYEVTRAYHGTDEENGELITDLTLKKVVTPYDIAEA